jgi:ABC-type Fe3+-siderophore transport system permease subunit
MFRLQGCIQLFLHAGISSHDVHNQAAWKVANVPNAHVANLTCLLPPLLLLLMLLLQCWQPA